MLTHLPLLAAAAALTMGTLVTPTAPLVNPRGAAQAKTGPMPEVGQAAPPFRLNNHQGELVSVGGESETWTVLAFFPKASTPG